MANYHTVYLHGGPMDGKLVTMHPSHTMLTCAMPPPVVFLPMGSEPFPQPIRVHYRITAGYAPYPDAPEQVYRLGILEGMDPAVELLKLLIAKDRNHG